MNDQYCPGCGVLLQTRDPQTSGYVPQIKAGTSTVCQRCFRIMHYGRLTGGRITEENLCHVVRTASGKADLTLLVADFFDPEGSLAPNWAELLQKVGTGAIRILVNKADLIPAKTPHHEVEEWMEALWRKRFPEISLAGVKAISARATEGFSSLLKELKGKKVALVGAANVGKSSLLVKLIMGKGREYAKKTPTVSSFPGTTQGITCWRRADYELELFDTPGLMPQSRAGDQLCPDCAKRLLPKQKLQVKHWEVPEGNAVLFGDLAGIWNVSLQPFTGSFFSGEEVVLHKTNSQKGEELFRQPPSWLRMICREDHRKLGQKEETFAVKPGEDLYISGLGWVAVKHGDLQLQVVAPQGVEVGVRPNLLGKR